MNAECQHTTAVQTYNIATGTICTDCALSAHGMCSVVSTLIMSISRFAWPCSLHIEAILLQVHVDECRIWNARNAQNKLKQPCHQYEKWHVFTYRIADLQKSTVTQTLLSLRHAQFTISKALNRFMLNSGGYLHVFFNVQQPFSLVTILWNSFLLFVLVVLTGFCYW